ncbi:hypothetical protein ACFE04_020525 [Oxalis oulophora]
MDDKELIDTAWFGNIYHKFETMCSDVGDAVDKEALRYVERKLQTAGTNVNRFCSNIMHDLIESFDDIKEKDLVDQIAVAEELSDLSSESKVDAEKCVKDDLINNDNYSFDDEEDKDLASPVIRDHSKTQSPSPLVDQSAVKEENVKEKVFFNDSNFFPAELTGGVVPAQEDSSIEVFPDSDDSTEAVGKLDDCMENDVTKQNAESIQPYHQAKLSESCIIVERHGLSSIANESKKSRSFKFSQIKLPGVFATRKSAKKQVCDQQNEISFISSAISMKSELIDEEISESDWEIVEMSPRSMLK